MIALIDNLYKNAIFFVKINIVTEVIVSNCICWFLCRMGSEEVEANRDKIITFLGIKKGCVDNDIDRVKKSLKLLKNKVICGIMPRRKEEQSFK